MAITAGAVAAGAAVAASAILSAAREEALLSGPEYIRDAQPEGLTRRIGLGLARATCKRYGNNPDAIDSRAAEAYEGVCRPYLDSIGAGVGAGIGLPFEGGQCAGTYYFVVLRFYNPTTGAPSGDAQYEGFGPVRIVASGNQAPGPGSSCAEGQTYYPGRALAFNGVERVSFGGGCAVRQTWEVLSITPRSGEPDNCGNQPPIVDQPQPDPTPTPNPEPFKPAPDIDLNFDVTLNFDGSVNIDIGTGPIVINPFGGGDGDGGGGEPGVGNPPGEPEPGPVIPGGNGGFGGDDELGEPPAGRRWVGVCLAITQRPEGFGTVKSNTVDKVYPIVVGNVRLICEAFGTEIVNTPVPIRSDRVCLWEPARGVRPVAIRVNLEPGFGYSYQGYAVPVDN